MHELPASVVHLAHLAEAGARGCAAPVLTAAAQIDRAASEQRPPQTCSGGLVVTSEVAQQPLSALPDALEHWDEIAARLAHRQLVLVLDVDGTLAGIESMPSAVVVPEKNRELLQELAQHCVVAVLSGRELSDVHRLVDLPGLWYAGSHGFEITAPDGSQEVHEAGNKALPGLDRAERMLGEALEDVPGVLLDRKRFGLAVHYRNVADDAVEQVITEAHRAAENSPELRVTSGRQVIELVPAVNWNKGYALRRILVLTGMADHPDLLPVYAGDDYTDEDALQVVHTSGLGFVVRSTEHGDRPTWAHYALADSGSLSELLTRIASLEADPARRKP